MIDPFFDFAQTANYFAPHPQWGSVPARGALGLGGLLARVGAPLFGPHHERHDHFPRWLSGDSLRTFLPRLSNPTGKATDPWASSRSASSASLATSSAGLRWPVRPSAFPAFRSAGWGSHGGQAAARPRSAARRVRGLRIPRTAAVASAAARGRAGHRMHAAMDRVVRAGAIQRGAVG